MIGAAALPATVDVLIVGGGATGAGLIRDLSRRGLRCLMIDKGDIGSGTSGRFHGLLHSGARYISRDPQAARECIRENRTIRRIAPACVEDTGGLFVATPDDPDDYVDRFAERCATAEIPCDEVSLDDVFRLEPALDRHIRRAFRVPDASLEPWQLIEANLADARGDGSLPSPITSSSASGGTAGGGVGHHRRSPIRNVARIAPRMVVSAAGAWAGRVAALAGAELEMAPGKGVMLVYNQRMTDTTINRCHPPADGDIMVPVHTVAILGTTDVQIADPDHYEVEAHEIDELIREGEKLFPDLRRMRLLRAYAGVRPLYDPSESAGSGKRTGDDREITRSHAVIDHEARDGIANFVSIVGGKLTTHRLMAEQTADLVAAKLGVDARCTTAEEPLPGQGRRSRALLAWRSARRARGRGRRGRRADLRVRVRHAAGSRPVPRRALAVQPGRRSSRDTPGHGPLPGRLLHLPRSGGRGRRGRRPDAASDRTHIRGAAAARKPDRPDARRHAPACGPRPARRGG